VGRPTQGRPIYRTQTACGSAWATRRLGSQLIYIYIHIYIYMCVCVYIYIVVVVCVCVCVTTCPVLIYRSHRWRRPPPARARASHVYSLFFVFISQSTINILVAPCFKNLLRLEAGYPALRCRCHICEEKPPPQRLEIIPPGLGYNSASFIKGRHRSLFS